jgi:inosine-uridine nucleoside N-ribohydrolase
MPRTPLVIDVDTGTDDAIAILCALLCADRLDVKAFTTVAGNVGVDRTSRNTLNLVDYVGRDVPVSVGAAKPLRRELLPARGHGVTGLGDVVLPPSSRAFHEKDAADTIHEHAVALGGALELLATGPLTNVATAIQRHPDLPRLIRRLTIMGGALIGGNVTQTSEFNAYTDPEAAKLVFEAGLPLTMVGLDVTLKPRLTAAYAEAVRPRGRFGEVAARIFDFILKRAENFGLDAPHIHDAIALAVIVEPRLLTLKPYYLTVETEGTITRGMTVADFNRVTGRPANVDAAVEIDVEGFWSWLVARFAA